MVADDLLTSSSAEATIQLASVETGTQQRDDHLRSSDFFDAATPADHDLPLDRPASRRARASWPPAS